VSVVQSHPVGILRSLQRYLRVLGALLRREAEIRLASPGESIVELLEPVFFIAIVTAAMWFVGRRDGSVLGGTPALFYASGFFALYFFNYISSRMNRAVSISMRRFPLERRLDHILVHIFLKTIDYSILGVLLFGTIYVVFTVQALPYDFVPIILAALALIMLGFGWGMLNLVLRRIIPIWPYISHGINRCMIIFAGIIFLIDFLPPTARYVLGLNPLAHAIALFRMGFYPNYPRLVFDGQFLFYCALFALVLGLVVERLTRRAER
jgi:capsular polysaccharide transport system permease protein